MQVHFDKVFPMPCSPAIGWEFLQNVEAVAACMPGATLTEKIDDSHHKGTVTVRLGPATMSFRGEVEVRDIDQQKRGLRLIGKGTDTSGSSGASMDLSARIDDADGGLCTLIGASDVSMSGKAAAFGGRMMNTVADQIMGQFADNFAAQVAVIQAQRSGSAEAGDNANADSVPPPRARELNALKLAWAVIRDWFRGLFGKKSK